MLGFSFNFWVKQSPRNKALETPLTASGQIRRTSSFTTLPGPCEIEWSLKYRGRVEVIWPLVKRCNYSSFRHKYILLELPCINSSTRAPPCSTFESLVASIAPYYTERDRKMSAGSYIARIEVFFQCKAKVGESTYYYERATLQIYLCPFFLLNTFALFMRPHLCCKTI